MASTCMMKTRGLHQREGGAPSSRALPTWSKMCNTTTITDTRTTRRTNRVQLPFLLSVRACPHCGDSACHCEEIAEIQRQWVQKAQRSILIHSTFPLPCHLTLRLRSRQLPSELIPDTAACKELYKGITNTIRILPLYTGQRVLRLGPNMPSASTTVLWNRRGMTANSVNQKKEEGSVPFPMLTLQLQNNSPTRLISLPLQAP